MKSSRLRVFILVILSLFSATAGLSATDDTTGQTGVSKTWRVLGSAKTALPIRTRPAHFIEARGANTSHQQAGYTGAILSLSNESEKSCKPGGDHIRGLYQLPEAA